MRVAVCIVGYRNPTDIEQCLGALARSHYQNFDVIICENGGAAACDELFRIAPRQLPNGQDVKVICAERNIGFAAGTNRCMANFPDADAWWLLNPDTIPEPEALGLLIDELKLGRAQMIGGTILDEQGVVSSCGGMWRPWLARAEVIADPGRDPSRMSSVGLLPKFSYISGSSLLVGRDFVAKVGPMREDYFLYGEEVEWALRGQSCGLRLSVASPARVVHKLGTSTGSGGSVRLRPKLPVYLDERNKMLITRDCFPQRLVIAAPSALILIMLRYGLRGAWRQVVFALQGWVDGLRNRRGRPDWVPV